jgi:2-polyprenyl-6-methoxyphenol hydroxylase-like FAD-dependent oxidoreductase
MARVRTALIVGAGIAGPACALALGDAGIEATVVEAYPGPADGAGAILTVAPPGLDALRTLGAHTAVLDTAQPVPVTVLADGAGHAFARHDAGGYVLARDTLARILSERAAAAGISVRYNRRLVGATAHPNGVVAHFADGTTAEADILIGADGIHSVVRTLIDPHAPEPAYEGVLGFGAAVAGGDVPVEPGVMHFAFGQRFLGYWRLPDDRVCWFAALPWPPGSPSAETPPRSAGPTWAAVAAVPRERWLAELRAAYVGHVPGQELLSRTEPGDLVPTGPMLRMPPLPHWWRDRMVVVGDAAHAPSSSSGQGASLALESALELARCLRERAEPGAAFAAYESVRRLRVEAVAAAAAAANRVKAGTQPAPRPSPAS